VLHVGDLSDASKVRAPMCVCVCVCVRAHSFYSADISSCAASGLLVLVCRVFLIGLLTFIDRGSILQCLAGLLVANFFLVFMAKDFPYLDLKTNVLAITGQSLVCLSYLSALLLRVDLTGEAFTVDMIGGVIISANVPMMTYLVYDTWMTMKEELAAAKIDLLKVELGGIGATYQVCFTGKGNGGVPVHERKRFNSKSKVLTRLEMGHEIVSIEEAVTHNGTGRLRFDLGELDPVTVTVSSGDLPDGQTLDEVLSFDRQETDAQGNKKVNPGASWPVAQKVSSELKEKYPELKKTGLRLFAVENEKQGRRLMSDHTIVPPVRVAYAEGITLLREMQLPITLTFTQTAWVSYNHHGLIGDRYFKLMKTAEGSKTAKLKVMMIRDDEDLEITVLSATKIDKMKGKSKSGVYAVVIVNGSRQATKTDPEGADDGVKVKWNHTGDKIGLKQDGEELQFHLDKTEDAIKSMSVFLYNRDDDAGPEAEDQCLGVHQISMDRVEVGLSWDWVETFQLHEDTAKNIEIVQSSRNLLDYGIDEDSEAQKIGDYDMKGEKRPRFGGGGTATSDEFDNPLSTGFENDDEDMIDDLLAAGADSNPGRSVMSSSSSPTPDGSASAASTFEQDPPNSTATFDIEGAPADPSEPAAAPHHMSMKAAGTVALAVAGARLIVKRQEGVRKHPKHGSDQMFVLKPGDVINVEETKVGKDGVERLKVTLDADDPANKHHKDKHKSKSGWIRTSDHHGTYVEPAPESALSLLGTSPMLSDVEEGGKRAKKDKKGKKKQKDSV
jgi:hypothetical protein